MEIIAHRGASAYAPENTLAAINKAVKEKSPAIALDVMSTLDDVPVVFHDNRLDRTTNSTGALSTRDLTEVKELDAGFWFSADFEGESIPTLEETLELLSGQDISIYLNLGGGISWPAVDKVIKEIQVRQLEGELTVLCINWNILEYVREVLPKVRIGYVVHASHLFQLAAARALRADNSLLMCDYRIILEDKGRAIRASAYNIPLYAWSVQKTDDLDLLIELGLKGVATPDISLSSAKSLTAHRGK